MNKRSKRVLSSVVIIVAALILLILKSSLLGDVTGGGMPGGSEPSGQEVVSLATTEPENTAKPSPEPTKAPEVTSEPTKAPGVTAEPTKAPTEKPSQTPTTVSYKFRSKKLLDEHYEKHGKDMGFASAKEYQDAASAVVNNPDALHKTEKEDGDDVYYIEATNEFVVVSKDGYVRTYFLPDSGKKYYDKQ